jgi:hypothetical protein
MLMRQATPHKMQADQFVENSGMKKNGGVTSELSLLTSALPLINKKEALIFPEPPSYLLNIHYMLAV